MCLVGQRHASTQALSRPKAVLRLYSPGCGGPSPGAIASFYLAAAAPHWASQRAVLCLQEAPRLPWGCPSGRAHL